MEQPYTRQYKQTMDLHLQSVLDQIKIEDIKSLSKRFSVIDAETS